MTDYEAPTITPLGSVQDLTHSAIPKTSGSGDVFALGGDTPPPPSVTSAS